MLLLSFVSSAFAVTVPLRAVHIEWVSPGETPLAAAATATVKVSNPTTGQGFKASANELTPTKVEATGNGDVSFDADPAGSIRTWAMYLINADGKLLGDPELVDVLFDENGNASLAGSTGGRLAGVTVRGTSPVGGEWAGGLVVEVQDSGADAAYVGLVEITSDGSRLATVPDLGILDLTTYATFQELGLDTIVALDRFRVRLDGDVELDDASVNAKGVIEDGQELRALAPTAATLADPEVDTPPARAPRRPRPCWAATSRSTGPKANSSARPRRPSTRPSGTSRLPSRTTWTVSTPSSRYIWRPPSTPSSGGPSTKTAMPRAPMTA